MKKYKGTTCCDCFKFIPINEKVGIVVEGPFFRACCVKCGKKRKIKRFAVIGKHWLAVEPRT